MTLNVIWFILIFVLLAGYCVLDGFDLGVGMIHLLHRDDRTRRGFISAIAPVWDGNEVWLLTGGGALFAAFPAVYATVFSGFYLALMLVLAGLIARAVSIEFRSLVDSARWRTAWDWVFGISSLALALLFGVAFGNVLRGVPIAPDGSFAGSFLGLLNPYALLVGILTVVLFFMHGAVYLACKTEGQIQKRLASLATGGWALTSAMFILVTAATWQFAPSLLQSIRTTPIPAIFAILFIGDATLVPIYLKIGRHKSAFAASSAVICSMMALGAVGLFPRLLPCLNDPALSLTVYNSCSSALTLRVMFIIALIGMPLVITYTALIHRVFRGTAKVTLDGY